MIVNLTPHTLNLHRVDGAVQEVPPSGTIARVAEARADLGELLGFGVTRPEYGQIENLPSPQEGVIFVVSALVLARTDRPDVFAPGPAVRDDDGRIVGAEGLSASAGYVAPAPTLAPDASELPAGADPASSMVELADGTLVPASSISGKEQLALNAAGKRAGVPSRFFPIPEGTGDMYEYVRIRTWREGAEMHPEFAKLDSAWQYIGGAHFSPHHATLAAVADGVSDLRGLLGDMYDAKAAARAGVAEWLTPRSGQRVVIHRAAGGKRQWGILYPEGMALEPAVNGGKAIYAGVKYRQLFKKGGARDFRIAYLITGAGSDTLEIPLA